MNGRSWGAGDTAILKRLVASGLTDDQIGARMKRHKDLIRRKRKELGLEPGQSALHTAMMARYRYRRRIARGYGEGEK